MRSKRSPKSKFRDVVFGVLTSIAFIPTNAFAQTMPWENPLRQLLSSLQGPTAQIIIIMAIVIAGLAFCIGEAGSFFRRCSAAVFGGAIAIGASTWAPTLFGW
jgi:type IV secretion system protein TrbC